MLCCLIWELKLVQWKWKHNFSKLQSLLSEALRIKEENQEKNQDLGQGSLADASVIDCLFFIKSELK